MIALVDDDASLRRSVGNLLSSAGFEVRAFGSAEEFMRSAAQAQLGCLVLDLRMPGMSGFDLVLRLRGDGSPLPIVVLTAHGDEDARAHCLAAGVVTFLTKPCTAPALLRAITAAMDAAPPR